MRAFYDQSPQVELIIIILRFHGPGVRTGIWAGVMGGGEGEGDEGWGRRRTASCDLWPAIRREYIS